MKWAWIVVLTLASPCLADVEQPPVSSQGTGGSKPTSGALGSSDNYLFTGSFLTTIPIEISPGIAGMQPELELQYNSGGGNGWIGVGWDLSLGTIQRSTKNGVPKYDDTDIFIVTLKGQTQELVRIPDGTYRAKIESAFQKFELLGDRWLVTDKSGTRYFFGQTSASRLHRSGNVAIPAPIPNVSPSPSPAPVPSPSPNPVPGAANDIFLWALDKIVDRNGNNVTLAYMKPAGDNQLYAAQINYTGHETLARPPNHKIVFTVENAPVAGYTLSAGFPIKTQYRLKTIVTDAWTYQLIYSLSSNTGRSLLTRVDRLGLDGVTKFPAATFDYQGSAAAPQFAGARTVPGGDWSAKTDDFVLGDYNGDGRQDYIWYRDQTMGAPGHVTGSGVYTSNGDGSFQNRGGLPDVNLTIPNNETLSGDFNGDGKSDIVIYHLKVGGEAGYGKIYLSNGDGSFRFTSALTGDFSTSQTRVLVADFNGDGFSDLAVYRQRVIGKIYFSNGDGSFRAGGDLPGTDYLNDSWRIFIGDFNGDGRSDVAAYGTASSGQKGSGLWFSNGDGSFAFKGPVVSNNFANNSRIATSDFNRDGMGDLIIWPEDAAVGLPGGVIGIPERPQATIYLSKGDGTFMATSSLMNTETARTAAIGDVNGDGNADLATYSNGSVSASPARLRLGRGDGTFSDGGTLPGNDFTTASNGLILADFDGDGRADLLSYRIVNSGFANLFLAAGAYPDLLSTASNGLGGQSVVTYRPSTQFSNQLLPFAMNVVGKIMTLDGRCNPQANECASTTYQYQGGYFDLSLREYLGFSRVDTLNANNDKTVTYFHQKWNLSGGVVPANAFKGRIYKTEAYDSAGKMLTNAETFWDSITPWPNVYFTRMKSVRTTLTDGSPAAVSQFDYTYDDAPTGAGFGNVTKISSLGDFGAGGDERTEVIEYASSPGVYLLNFPRRKTTLGPDGTTVADTRFYYDGLPWGTLTKGNLTRVEQWLDRPTARWIPTTSEYDASGQITAIIDSLGRRAETTYDANGFAVSVKNPLGQIAGSSYDVRTGNVLSNIDINNQTTNYRYDALGRLVKAIGPLDSDALPTVETNYHAEVLGQPQQQFTEVLRREQHGQPSTLWTKSYFDGLGRVYLTKQKDVGGNSVVVETAFNNRGLAAKTSVPRFESPASAPLWTETSYDALHRVIQIRNPDATGTTLTYAGRVTQSQDANGRVQSSVADAYGRIVQRNEPSIVQPTRYQYDALGNLIRVTDSQGKITSFGYDSLKRKLSMSDSNAGVWTYEYDDAGSISRQVDARGVDLRFTYDGMNRLRTKTLAADPGAATGETIGTVLGNYTYDETDAVNRPFSKGKLTTLQDPSSITRLYHNSDGYVTKEVKEVDAVLYTTQLTYDALGRPTQIVTPSGQVTSYSYDESGRQQKITDGAAATYWTASAFDALSRAQRIDQGNGVIKTTYAFDPLKQTLASLKTESQTLGVWQTLQNFSYQYDPVGNLNAIVDNADPSASQLFNYDPLYRLSRAQGGYGDQNFAYDQLGNFTKKNHTAYKYADAAHPYAVTQTVPDAPPAQDASTMLAWNLDPKEPIYTISGTLRDVVGQPARGVPLTLSGTYDQAMKSDNSGSSNNQGTFQFRGVPGGPGAVYSLFVSSIGLQGAPAGYLYNPLTGHQSNVNFTVTVDTNPLNITRLRLPRSSFALGRPAIDSGNGMTTGLIGGLGYGGLERTMMSIWTDVSGYSAMPDKADTMAQPPAQYVLPPQAFTSGILGPAFVDGRYEQALSFNGASDLFVFPNSQNANPSNLTLMLWVKPTANPSFGYAALISKSSASLIGFLPSGYRLSMDGTGRVIFELGRAGSSVMLTSAQALAANKWTFIAATYDGTKMKLYLDGQEVGSQATTVPILANPLPVSLAASLTEFRQPMQGTFFQGVLDEPRIHNRAWSAAEIFSAKTVLDNIASYTYDANGNCLTKVTPNDQWAYRFNSQGRLAQISLNGAVKATFAYDELGNRVKKITPTGTTLYIGKLFEIRPGNNKISHLFAGNNLVCDIAAPSVVGRAPVVSYVQLDHLGSVSLVIDGQGKKLQQTRYQPFGEIYQSTGSSMVTDGYTGQEFDGDIGLSYYNARYYDSSLGRFISPDAYVPSLFDPQALGRYAYVRNTPLMLTDPTGNSWFSRIWNKAGEILKNIFSRPVPPPRSDPEQPKPESPADPGPLNPIRDGRPTPADDLSRVISIQQLSFLAAGPSTIGTSIVEEMVMDRFLHSGTMRDVASRIIGHKADENEVKIVAATIGLAMSYSYYKLAGYEQDMRPGNGYIEKSSTDAGVRGFNNIGYAHIGDPVKGLDEGGRISEFLNVVAGINATAAVHDRFQTLLENNFGSSVRNSVIPNVVGMPIAAGITFPALFWQPTYLIPLNGNQNIQDSR